MEKDPLNIGNMTYTVKYEKKHKNIGDIIYYVITVLKNCMHVCVTMCTMYTKALKLTLRSTHASFEIKILLKF